MTQAAEKAWKGLPPEYDGAASSTVEALMLSLRERGAGALAEANTRRRLGNLSPAQVREVIERLDRLRQKYPAITDELLLQLAERIQ